MDIQKAAEIGQTVRELEHLKNTLQVIQTARTRSTDNTLVILRITTKFIGHISSTEQKVLLENTFYPFFSIEQSIIGERLNQVSELFMDKYVETIQHRIEEIEKEIADI